MINLLVSLIFLSTSSPLQASNLSLKDAEQSILGFVNQNDFYIYGEEGYFKEPCSGEVDISGDTLRLIVMKLSTQRNIDMQFNKLTGRTRAGDQLTVEQIVTTDKSLQINFGVKSANLKMANSTAFPNIYRGPSGLEENGSFILKVENTGEMRNGQPLVKMTLKSDSRSIDCQGIEH